jgi:hypothetical protein
MNKREKELLKKLRTAYQVCRECGDKYGRYVVGCSSVWIGKCQVCDKEGVGVTESRDYNYLSEGIRKLVGNDNRL